MTVVADVIDYVTPGLLTDLSTVDSGAFDGIGVDVVDICLAVQALVIQPDDARRWGVAEQRMSEQRVRPVGALIGVLQALDPSPLAVARAPRHRVVGTCRHFAVLGCALLRHQGIPARARCGFATYFQPGLGLDHWITEYWHGSEDRWVRVDPEILGQSVAADPCDLSPGEFLTGGEAWSAYRLGQIDAALFGVSGTNNWGPAEIRGNTIRDLAALNKVEMLPWDNWGRMDASYNGETGSDYDAILDSIASACAVDGSEAASAMYAIDEFRVPTELVQ